MTTIHNTVGRAATYDEIIADPLFKKGYAQVWAGEEHAIQRQWSDDEQEAYERGRQFANWLIGIGEEKLRLTQGYLAHPRAKNMLLMAMREKAVL